ncbi:hypothetical protein A5886_000570 [Enterococcus sp. 8G7_MSG3316]|uniref:Mga helix-turn-helix domain-containing protein n=1 Tax=Candidatus Enterococcus testudinis TaxID=1834191 RepID=A0A242A3M9_9ENTE|nr:helix-turn-helix domain-containing protein [Enterococcus sp. 8G7_MSG3316]OTN75500.1 hypothetical protein A5886_000570 [Enterococcus sp. 8G7_MSG3316]
MRELQINFILNKTTVRWFQLLNDFERERTCSLTAFAAKLHVTQRTISSDIKGIKEHFGDSIQLTQVAYGYYFTEKAPMDYLEKKRQLVSEEGLYQLMEGIFHGELHPIEEWAYRLHVSESTLRRYLQGVAPILKNYGLTIGYSPVNMKGNETNIRKFFQDFYYEADVTPHTLLPPKELVDMVMVDMDVSPAKIRNSDIPPTDFFYALFIIIERCREKNYVTVPDRFAYLIRNISGFTYYNLLKERIIEEYGVEIPEKEFIWLYLLTVTKRTLTEPLLEKDFIETYSFWPEFRQISQAYTATWSSSFKQTQDIECLIHSFFVAKKIADETAPALNGVQAEIRELAQESPQFKQNLSFLNQQQNILGYSPLYLEDISASLTLYQEAIREYYDRPIQRIAVVLEGNLQICQSIRARFLRYVGNDMQVYFPRINEVTTGYLALQQIDLVVTNYSEYLTDFILVTDYLLLKAIPDRFDWMRVIQKINPQLGEAIQITEQ